jgi:hypothetical protein
MAAAVLAGSFFPGKAHGVFGIDSVRGVGRYFPEMVTAFPFKRPERRLWNWASPIFALAVLAWCGVFPNHGFKPVHIAVFVGILVYWGFRLSRFHKLPPLSLEIDEQEIRLLPSFHWGIDPIPRSSVYGVREERTSIFVLYRRNGVDKAIELERHFFDRAAWQQLPGLLPSLPTKKSAEAAAGIR